MVESDKTPKYFNSIVSLFLISIAIKRAIKLIIKYNKIVLCKYYDVEYF